jgi:hypothetical protein
MVYNLQRRGRAVLDALTHLGEGLSAAVDISNPDYILSSIPGLDIWAAPFVYQAASYSDLGNAHADYISFFQTTAIDFLSARMVLESQSMLASMVAAKNMQGSLPVIANLICSNLLVTGRTVVKPAICKATLGWRKARVLQASERVIGSIQLPPLVINDHAYWFISSLSAIFDAQCIILLPNEGTLPEGSDPRFAERTSQWLPWLRRLHQRNTAPLPALHAQSLPLSLAAALTFLTMLHDMNGWTVNARTWDGARIGTWAGLRYHLGSSAGLDDGGRGRSLPADATYAVIPIIYPSCFTDALRRLNDSAQPSVRSFPFYNASVVHLISLDSRCWLGAVHQDEEEASLSGPTRDQYRAFLRTTACEGLYFRAPHHLENADGDLFRMPVSIWRLMNIMRTHEYCTWRPLDLAGMIFARPDFRGHLQ